jgi:non-heme chloroperoxidase
MAVFTTNDGVELAYTDEGTGPLVVSIAGYTASRSTWMLTHDALLEAGYRSVLFDRRSHGDSETPPFGQRMARHGADIHGLLEHLDTTDAVLVGQSMGANAVWAFIDLFGSRGVRAVVAVDQTPKMINIPDWPHGFYGITPENAGTFFRDGIPATGRGLPVESILPGLERLAARVGSMPPSRDPGAAETVGLLDDHLHQDWRDVIARIDVPFLLVAGAESQLWPAEHATASARSNPLGRSVEIAGGGHTVHVDRADEFNRVLLDFLREA